MNKPLVSVILAVRNGEKYLETALKSIFEQSFQDYEIILIDGKSEDRTAEIAKSHASIRYLYQQGQGIADAYNLGIEKAKGKILAFISHDDLWTADKLDIQANYLQAHPEMQYTIAKVKFFLEAGQTVPNGFRKELFTGEHVGMIMETLVVRKKLFELVGNFNSDYHVAEDVDWFSRAKDAGILYHVVDQVLLHKRVHNANTSLNSSVNDQNLLNILRQSIKRKRNN
jgi:glycosyltransferase involved in cell wall biosynthesis